MKEPVEVLYNDKTYVRWDWRVWTCDGSTHPNGLRQRVTDIALVTQLEKAYSDQQRQHTPQGPRPPIITGHDYHTPTVRSKGQVTPREKRANGRVE